MSFAFFDFDNTLIDGDAGPAFGAFLFRERFASINERHDGAKRRAKHLALWSHIIPYGAWMGIRTALYKARAVRRSGVVRSAYKGFRGVAVEPLHDLFRRFANEHIQDLVFPDMVDAMQEHIAAGRTCVIITTGMEALVKECLPFLPPCELIGCRLEAKDGRLTGRVVQGPLYGADKANIIAAYCRAAGVDPADCYAYSDHYSDHHMLEAVGHGVCVNPAPRLQKMAAQQGWAILRPKRLQ